MESWKPEKIEAKEVNSLHSEHLNSDVKPIMISVGTSMEHEQIQSYLSKLIEKAEKINFFEEGEVLDKEGIDNQGTQSYVISQINENPKRSSSYINCTGLVVVGTDKESRKNISIVTHQEPSRFLREFKDEFKNDLTKKLQELSERCEEGTIDAVIIGGNYMLKGYLHEKYQRDYKESLKALTDIVHENFDFDLVVASGPKVKSGADSMLFDTENRRLYLSRNIYTKMNNIDEAYNVKDFNTQKDTWGEDRNSMKKSH